MFTNAQRKRPDKATLAEDTAKAAAGHRVGATHMLNMKVVSWSVAIWTASMFVFCVIYGMLTPSGLHMSAFLQQVLPGYEPGNWSGFLYGLIQSFLYGAFGGLVYVPIYNFMHRKWLR